MTSSKSTPKRRLSNFLSRSAPTFLQPVQESEEESEAVPNKKMIQQRRLQWRPSRFQRLSQFFPTLIITTDSKTMQDSQRPQVPQKDKILRKPAPAQYGQSSPAPSRVPPRALSTVTAQIPPPPNSSHKLHKKPDSLNLSKPQPRAQSPSPNHAISNYQRPRGNSLAPPRATDIPQGRSVSSPVNSRPNSYHSEGEEGSSTSRLGRKSWLRGRSRSRNVSQDLLDNAHPSHAWVNTGSQKIDYNLSLLINGEKVRHSGRIKGGNANTPRCQSCGMRMVMCLSTCFPDQRVVVPRSEFPRSFYRHHSRSSVLYMGRYTLAEREAIFLLKMPLATFQSEPLERRRTHQNLTQWTTNHPQMALLNLSDHLRTYLAKSICTFQFL